MPTTLSRLCDLCGETDGLPRDHLILDDAADVALRLHLLCAAELANCPGCGPALHDPAGISGEALRARILTHHRKDPI